MTIKSEVVLFIIATIGGLLDRLWYAAPDAATLEQIEELRRQLEALKADYPARIAQAEREAEGGTS